MKIITPSLIILSLFVIGGMIFKLSAPITCGDFMQDDTVFVLTGDARRIPFAMQKINEIQNANLYIIGAGAHGYIQNESVPVKIESNSKSTYQNALAIKKIVKAQNLNRIVIVTTVEHMNRAEYLIRHEIPDVSVIACPVGLNGMPVAKRVERWTTEYIKYIATMLGIKEG
ncbi:MAG: YdcF family protein [Proteobacteria bacterium]|nr:YdcF family protein [Candidatus Enterousia scatequi]